MNSVTVKRPGSTRTPALSPSSFARKAVGLSDEGRNSPSISVAPSPETNPARVANASPSLSSRTETVRGRSAPRDGDWSSTLTGSPKRSRSAASMSGTSRPASSGWPAFARSGSWNTSPTKISPAAGS